MTHPSRLLVLLPILLGACGGKIAGDLRGSTGDDPDRVPISSPGPGPTSSPSPSSPFVPAPSPSSSSGLGQPSASHIVDDACAAICERNGECGAGQPDCAAFCAKEILGASSCAAQASAYIQCYANNLLPGCAALPPVCESAYCAYTICAGKVVPDYCDSR